MASTLTPSARASTLGAIDVVDGVRNGKPLGPEQYTNTGHMTEPTALVVSFVLGRDFSVAEVFAAHRRKYDRSRTFACAHCALELPALLFYVI